MKDARLAKTILFTVWLASLAVLWRRIQPGRPTPPSGTTASPAAPPSPTPEVNHAEAAHPARRHVGVALALIIPLAIVSALAWWWLAGPLGFVPAFLASVLLVALGFWKLPQWQAEGARRHGDETSFFELENEARKTLGAALSGLFLVIGLAATWQQLATDRGAQHDVAVRAATEQALTREGQITDRFTAAVNQLGSDQLRVRLGGIYALERIARDSSPDAGPVMEILTAFVRERAPWPPPTTAIPPALGGPKGPAPSARLVPSADIQAVLTVIGRGNWDRWWPGEAEGARGPGGLFCLNLDGTDLRGARLRDKKLPPLCMGGANLAGANLTGADLGGARMPNADLTGAFLTGADLTGAYLRYAVLADAHLTDVRLTGADLGYANVAGDDLTGADVERAILSDTNLAGADLTGVSNLTQKQLDSAEADADTKVPPGLHVPPARSDKSTPGGSPSPP